MRILKRWSGLIPRWAHGLGAMADSEIRQYALATAPAPWQPTILHDIACRVGMAAWRATRRRTEPFAGEKPTVGGSRLGKLHPISPGKEVATESIQADINRPAPVHKSALGQRVHGPTAAIAPRRRDGGYR